MVLDFATVGAYTEPGPSFAQAIFVKQFLGDSKGLQQNIAGVALSTFHTKTLGTYELGLRFEIPYNNIACYGMLTLNGAVILQQTRVSGLAPVSWTGEVLGSGYLI